MPKIATKVKVPVNSHLEAHNALISAITPMKAKVASDSEGKLVLKRGSRVKARTIGGIFLSASDLPVLATVEFDSRFPNEINVSVIENFGFGTIAGMGDKFQIACTEFAKLIADAVKSGEN